VEESHQTRRINPEYRAPQFASNRSIRASADQSVATRRDASIVEQYLDKAGSYQTLRECLAELIGSGILRDANRDLAKLIVATPTAKLSSAEEATFLAEVAPYLTVGCSTQDCDNTIPFEKIPESIRAFYDAVYCARCAAKMPDKE
jgi:hypothetical protein